jgi:Uma2 family endonuclease
MTVTSPPIELIERQRRITVEEYHRMIDAGVLGEDDHVELIEGFLVDMAPQKSPPAYAIQRLTRLLARMLADEFDVRVQLPLALGRRSEPEPDMAVVRTSPHQAREHPDVALLVVEVSRGSLLYDRTVKARLYARHALPEYWIVDVADGRIEVHRDPDPAAEAYRTVFTVGPGQPVTAASIPGVTIDPADFLP